MPRPAAAPPPSSHWTSCRPRGPCCPHLCGLQAEPAPPASATAPSPNHPGPWGLPEPPLSPETHLKLSKGRSHPISPWLKPSEGLPRGIRVQTRPCRGAGPSGPPPAPPPCSPLSRCAAPSLPLAGSDTSPRPVSSKQPSLTPAHRGSAPSAALCPPSYRAAAGGGTALETPAVLFPLERHTDTTGRMNRWKCQWREEGQAHRSRKAFRGSRTGWGGWGGQCLPALGPPFQPLPVRADPGPSFKGRALSLSFPSAHGDDTPTLQGAGGAEEASVHSPVCALLHTEGGLGPHAHAGPSGSQPDPHVP